MTSDLHPSLRPLAHSLQSRRQVLSRLGMGFGGLALNGLLDSAAAAERPSVFAPKQPHFAPKAKRVIHFFMNGGPSQVDTFDRKPLLDQYDGKALPNLLKTERPTGAAFKSPFKFDRYGESGLEVSELFAQTAAHADDLCLIRSMHADVPNHEPSLGLMNCGESRLNRPSFGSWVNYGLGTENENLPGYVALCPGGMPVRRSKNWQSAFLPSSYQGTYVDTKNMEVERLLEFIRNPSLDRKQQRRQLDLLYQLNDQHAEQRQRDEQLDARIQSYELAYRMQAEATDAFDISRESETMRSAYGDNPFGRQTLMARRLLERGVRFIQLWTGDGQPWDSHDEILNHATLAKDVDRAMATFITDLKQRGMFDDTLIIWGGEFGRTPAVELPKPGSNQGKQHGRDHNHYGFSMWLAGGGTRGGYVHGATDEFGFAAVENPVHVHDLHATLLRLLGFDHERFTFKHAGLDYRLTGVNDCSVVKELIA